MCVKKFRWERKLKNFLGFVLTNKVEGNKSSQIFSFMWRIRKYYFLKNYILKDKLLKF